MGPGPPGPASGVRQAKTVGPGGPDATHQSQFFTSSQYHLMKSLRPLFLATWLAALALPMLISPRAFAQPTPAAMEPDLYL